MKRLILSTIAIGMLISFSGCSTRLGNMTVVSTNNVGGLNAKVSDTQRTKGKSCIHTALIFPFGDIQNRLQIATDNAIDNGHKAGLKGDVLINAKIDISSWYIPFIYGENCMEVNGDLIDMSSSMK
jgi:hypothetical protein